MATLAHSKIINKVASEVLKPTGVKRKGQSRTWLDDNGWWILVVEFQPSGWSKGTHLNVGVNWLWYPKEHLSFDLGYREAEFVEYKSDAQFEPKARELALIAKGKVQKIRYCLSNIQAAKTYIVGAYSKEPKTIWTQLHLGMICALAGSSDEAIAHFTKVIQSPEESDWALALKQFTDETRSIVSSSKDFKAYTCNIVGETRRMLKLEDWKCEFA